jgi:Lar family restriction alleviation protein
MSARGETLLPCPFCGSKAAIQNFEEGRGGKSTYIRCPKCETSPDNCYVDFAKRDEAIAFWNTRVH